MAENKERKITKKVVLTAIVDYFKDDDLEVNGIMSSDIVNYAQHEIELLERKASKSGTTKLQKENEELKNEIVAELTRIGRPVTISTLCEETEVERVASMSNQKASAMLKQLVDTKVIYKEIIKKKAYFSATEIDTEELAKAN